MLFSNINHVSLGNRVSIRSGARIEVVSPLNDVVIRIGDNVNIEQNVHIVGMCSIVIEDNVSITGNCSIVDVVHPFDDISAEPKIGARVDSHHLGVRIGMGSFVGYGAHISPGVHIGKNCVVGAMSVVTKSVPDYCVVAGNPAKIIKKYNFETASWERIGQ
ncbi:acyltransferase [Aeromonas caviae]|nr:acyltransferase [Aeromonas caviae]